MTPYDHITNYLSLSKDLLAEKSRVEKQLGNLHDLYMESVYKYVVYLRSEYKAYSHFNLLEDRSGIRGFLLNGYPVTLEIRFRLDQVYLSLDHLPGAPTSFTRQIPLLENLDDLVESIQKKTDQMISDAAIMAREAMEENRRYLYSFEEEWEQNGGKNND